MKVQDRWEEVNIGPQYKLLSLVGIALVISTSVIDFLSLDESLATSFFLLRIAICSAIFATLIVAIRGRGTIGIRLNRTLFLLAAWSLSVGYLCFFLFVDSESLRADVNIGVLTVVLALHASLYRFEFVHRFWSALTFLSLLIFASITTIPFYALVASHVAGFCLAEVFRPRYFANLTRSFYQLRRIAPRRVAERLTLSNLSVDETSFRPQNRYCVCLLSDWRSFQKLTQTLKHEEISQIFQEYYDEIYKNLEILIPSGEYFVDWNADELFVVFYSEDNDRVLIQQRVEAFINYLIGDAYDTLQTISPVKVLFDVGLSSGNGLLGLMGPTHAKKTTIASPVPGRAKRLEEEAKKIRKKSPCRDLLRPVVVMDQSLSEAYADRFQLCEWVASAKDIEDEKVFFIQQQIFELYNPSMQSKCL